MIMSKTHFAPILNKLGYKFFIPKFKQTLSKNQIFKIIAKFDAWIVGDDLVSEEIIKIGKAGKLKVVIKWGIGTDNIDLSALKKMKIYFSNTPNMFGDEVSDLAISYLISLSRYTFFIDREIRSGSWTKIQGNSLKDKVVGVIGYGNIGKKTVTKLKVFGVNIVVYDPYIKKIKSKNIKNAVWPNYISDCDYLIFTCSLSNNNKFMLNKNILKKCKKGICIINVSRGGLINEDDLIYYMKKKYVKSVALDVFFDEPLEKKSYFTKHKYSILGSHNASNTIEAVQKTNKIAIKKLNHFLNLF